MRFFILYTPCFLTDYIYSFINYNKIWLSNSYNNTGVLKNICVLYIYIIYIMYEENWYVTKKQITLIKIYETEASVCYVLLLWSFNHPLLIQWIMTPNLKCVMYSIFDLLFAIYTNYCDILYIVKKINFGRYHRILLFHYLISKQHRKWRLRVKRVALLIRLARI